MNPYEFWLPTFAVAFPLLAALHWAVKYEARKLWRTEGPPPEEPPAGWRAVAREFWRAVRYSDAEWDEYSAERDGRA